MIETFEVHVGWLQHACSVLWKQTGSSLAALLAAVHAR